MHHGGGEAANMGFSHASLGEGPSDPVSSNHPSPTKTWRFLHAIDPADPTLGRAADVTDRVDRPREINATPVPRTKQLVRTLAGAARR